MMVGVPPYSPGDYIDVNDDGDTVDVWLAPYFTRPLRLTAAEGLALLAAGRALLAVPGSDPTARSRPRSPSSRPRSACPEVVVDVARTDAPRRGARRAAERGERIEIDYWSAGRDELDDPPHRPGPPFFALGEWYIDAYCHLRGETRMFRVDRIRARARDRRDVRAGAGRPRSRAVYHPRPDDRRVTLELAARRPSWVAESYPGRVGRRAPDDGTLARSCSR